MGSYFKGNVTKQIILDTARKLFYTKGYHQTTTREIAREGNVNLGLITYYFKNKSGIAGQIYLDVRQSLHQQIGDLYPSCDIHNLLLKTMLNVKLQLEYPSYAALYLAIAHEDIIREIEGIKIRDLREHYPVKNKELMNDTSYSYSRLTEVSLLALKPAVVQLALDEKEMIPKEVVLRYIAHYYANNIGEDLAVVEQAYRDMEGLEVVMTDSFEVTVTRKASM